MTDDVYTNIDKLIALHEKQNDLMRELKKALRMADLLGKKPGEIKGKLVAKVTRGNSQFRPWTGAVYSIRVGDDPWEDFPLIDVHKELWPTDLLDEWRRWDRQREKQAQARRTFGTA